MKHRCFLRENKLIVLLLWRRNRVDEVVEVENTHTHTHAQTDGGSNPHR